jgi:hypothetical protein
VVSNDALAIEQVFEREAAPDWIEVFLDHHHNTCGE